MATGVARGDRRRVDAALKVAPIVVPYVMLLVLVARSTAASATPSSRCEELNIQAAAVMTLLLVAAGQTIVILLGGIDLSVGGVVSLTTALAATRLDGARPRVSPAWLAAIVLLGPALGALNGLLVSRLRLQPFIVTLATWSVWSGVALWILPTEGGTIPQKLIDFAKRERALPGDPGLADPRARRVLGLVQADAHGDRDHGDRLERELRVPVRGADPAARRRRPTRCRGCSQRSEGSSSSRRPPRAHRPSATTTSSTRSRPSSSAARACSADAAASVGRSPARSSSR